MPPIRMTQQQLDALAGVGRSPVRPRPRQKAASARKLEPPGTVLARFEVDGKAIPWRAPISDKRGVHRTEEHVKRWKEHIARTAKQAGYGESVGQIPYPGPVEVLVFICKKCPRSRRPGDRCDTRPDADNLFKGIGDAISGNVFKQAGKDPVTGKRIKARHMPPSPIGRILDDDKTVTDVKIRKRYWSRSLVWIEVIAIARQDPGPFPFAP